GVSGDEVGAHVDLFGREDLVNALGNVVVLAAEEAGTALQDGHLAAEAAIHLREFERDVAAAEDDEVGGERVEVDDGGVGEVRNLVEAGERRDGGGAAHGGEDVGGGR